MGSGNAFPFKQRRYNPLPQEVSACAGLAQGPPTGARIQPEVIKTGPLPSPGSSGPDLSPGNHNRARSLSEHAAMKRMALVVDNASHQVEDYLSHTAIGKAKRAETLRTGNPVPEISFVTATSREERF